MEMKIMMTLDVVSALSMKGVEVDRDELVDELERIVTDVKDLLMTPVGLTRGVAVKFCNVEVRIATEQENQ